MKFTMTRPCDDCPFRKVDGIALTKERIKEISRCMLDSQGGTFPCHRTVDYEGGDESEEVHCAGALAYALKQDTLPQIARIVERMGDMNANAILDNSGDLVWDSERQWLKHGGAYQRMIRSARHGSKKP